MKHRKRQRMKVIRHMAEKLGEGEVVVADV